MEKKIKYVFLSNGYKGGASTFIYDHICYLEALKKKIILIDDNPNNTYDKISKNVEVNKIKT